jgi:beta-aspartyl-peptidase (threonine type)
MMRRLAVLLAVIPFLSCATAPPEPSDGVQYAIVAHGGAGYGPHTLSSEEQLEYKAGLERALRAGLEILSDGGSSLDAVEMAIRHLEDDPRFNAGRGAVFNHDGEIELDASIMDGATLACGGVAGVRTVRNPISLARLVMDETRHVLLISDGAERFAERMGLEPVDREYFYTQRRWESLQRARRAEELDAGGDTVGAVALDRQGNLAAGTSTGGLTNKMFGRVGDSPIIGAGTYASNESCAVSCSGVGEEFMRRNIAFQLSSLMEHGGMTLQEAAEEVVERQLAQGDGGLIAVGAGGEVAMVFNTPGMLRGVADSTGRIEVRIWD